MSSYVEGALVKDERLVHSGHMSLWSMWHLLALGVVLLPAFGLGLIFLVMAYVRYKSTELAVTTKWSSSSTASFVARPLRST